MLRKSLLADIEANPKNYKKFEDTDKILFGPPYAVLNTSKLGYRYFRVFLKISKGHSKKVIEKFEQHPNIGLILEAKYWFNLALGFWATDNNEIAEIINNLRLFVGNFGKIIHISELNYLVSFGSRPIHGVFHPKIILDSRVEKVKVGVEEFELLKQLSLNAGLSNSEYAGLLNLKEEKIISILNNLEQLGIISGYQSRVNYPGKYYKIFINTLGLSNNQIDNLTQKLWNDRRCVYIERSIGKYDYEFEMIVDEKQELKKYLNEIKDYKVVQFTKNVYMNILPISKILDVNELFDLFKKEKNSNVINLCQPKLWYLTNSGSRAWLKTYKNEAYSELMKDDEVSLLETSFEKISKYLNKSAYCVVDLGSGDGKKGLEFIKDVPNRMVSGYYPIDINLMQLSKAIALHEKRDYKLQPYLLDFENLKSRFPLQLHPSEGQIYLLLGGSYGNFNLEKINSILEKLVNSENSVALVSINIRDFSTQKKIIKSYSNSQFQEYVIQPLKVFGFSEDDFSNNKDKSKLKVQLMWVDNGIVSQFLLNKDKALNGINFKKGAKFFMTFSWKPTIKEFREALEKKVTVIDILNNNNSAIAIISKK